MRGGGQEQLATGVNPAFNRERFEEAHDLIVKAWTQPGPFRWEGTHYQHRVVNPWAVPLQKPHPRVWIPGVLSKETIIWAAQQRYPVHRAEHLDRGDQEDLGALRRGRGRGRATRRARRTAATCSACHVAETEEKAIENARQFMWMQGEFTGLAHPVWSSPSGLLLAVDTARHFVEFAVGRRANPARRPAFEEQIARPA